MNHRSYKIVLPGGTCHVLSAASIFTEAGGQLSIYGYDTGPKYWGIYLIRIYARGEWVSVHNLEGEAEWREATEEST